MSLQTPPEGRPGSILFVQTFGDLAEARDWEVAVRLLACLTSGDFAVAARQLELWRTAAIAAEHYEHLRRECAAKEGPARAIGFTA